MIRGTGSYFDGASAARRAVEVELARWGVLVREAEPGGRELAFWEYRDLRRVDEWAGNGPLRIRARNRNARLVVESPAVIAALCARATRLAARETGWSRLSLRWAGLLALCVAVLLVTLRHGLPRFADEVARIVPHRWEAEFGATLVEPVLLTFARLDGADEVAYCTAPGGVESLAEITRRLALPGSPFRFTVRVVDLDMVNAFALPGGQIVIAEGLLRAAGSPDEIAGVLAHEMGHVLHRHSTAAIIEGLGLAFLFGALLGDAGTGFVAGAGEVLVGLSFRREAEAEADERALDLLERAGMSSRGLADFFERMERKTGDRPAVLRLLSTHPSTERRRRLAEERSTPDLPASLDEDSWRRLKTICRRKAPINPS
ncbi:MAG: M48 family metallopeptidase [Immundisolibacterales bacterium]|nr:M48 family metallopeptidase [Immundisolibacterales bacterium]